MLTYTGERCIPEFMEDRTKIYQQHLNRYSFALVYTKKRKVLDASCGCGWGTDILMNVAEDVLGVDVSKEAIKYAKKNFKGRFQVMDLDKEFPNDEDFEMVVSFETIEHLNNPDFFLENIKKRSNGFVFSIPIGKKLTRFHKKAYDINDVKELMERHFDNTKWFSQCGKNIYRGIQGKKCNYLIGSVRIKPQKR